MWVEGRGSKEKEGVKERKRRRGEDRRSGAPRYNWRLTRTLFGPTNRLHPVGRGWEAWGGELKTEGALRGSVKSNNV